MLVTQAPCLSPFHWWLLDPVPLALKAAYSQTLIAPLKSTCLRTSLVNAASWLVAAHAQHSSIALHVAETDGTLVMELIEAAERDAD